LPAAPQFPANSTPDFVMIKGCYSNYSVVDRPWRAYNNIITVSCSSSDGDAQMVNTWPSSRERLCIGMPSV